jgi:TonB family protein
MEAFALYLLKSVIWLTGFALVYFLFLRNERFFRLKRYYLVAGILVSIIFPLLTFHYQVEMTAQEINTAGITPSDAAITTAVQPVLSEKPFDFRYILLLVYLSGIAFLAFKAVRNTGILLKAINKTKINYRNKARLVRTTEFSSSFSFLNYVFVNPEVDDKELDVIMNHELVHVNQKHWLDLLLVELLRLFQWVNPFVWIYTRFIKQNHEYIADEIMLRHTPDPAIYKAVLVNQLFDSRVISLSNLFNYSLNKKRFDMMKKIITSPYRKLKILFVLPVFAIVFYAFATPEYNYIMPSGLQRNNALTSETIEKEAKGVVVNEEGTPLQGVKIVVAKSLTGVITDANGRFAISRIPDGSSLIFSYKGYKTYTLPPLISSNSALYVKLVKDPDYKEQNAVKIRMSDGSQAKPLIVVDGVVSTKGVEEIDPSKIVNVNVLKDKPATDKYGEKGKNGVIEITTKKNTSEVQVATSQASGINQKTVKGIVLQEDGQPLEGVSINSTSTTGSTYLATTAKDGHFELNNVQANASLFFYCRGYIGQTLKADFSKEMSVKMRKDPEYKAPTVTNPGAPAVQRPELLVVIDGVISDKKYVDVVKELGYNRGINKAIMGKEATDKYGEKGANGVVEITTRKKALEMGLNPPFPRLAPEDFPTFQNQRFTNFNSWVADQVKYPSEAQTKELEGWVIVNFTVELNGTISNVTSTTLVDPILSEEVIRVIRNSPKWEPPKNSAVDEPFISSVTLKFQLPDQIIREAPFVVVEQMPQYPGYETALLDFIKTNTKYPEELKAEKVEGRVIVRFIVNTKGTTEGISVLKSVHPLLDAEAVRVVSLLSGFKPGMQGGKAVNVWYMVPVNFTVPN